MNRRAVGIAWTLALVLCLLVWIRSYLPEYFFIRADRGRVIVIFAAAQFAVRIDPFHHPISGYPGAHTGPALAPDQILFEARNFAALFKQRGNWTGGSALGFELIWTDMKLGHFLLVIPFWAIAIPLAGGTACAWIRWHRRRFWNLPGRCRSCGYDVRGITDRCPECGTTIDAGPERQRQA